MGCADSKQNIVIEVSYCGSCGWSTAAKILCEAIKERLNDAILDCKP